MIIEEEMKEEMKEDVDPHNGADDGKFGTHLTPSLRPVGARLQVLAWTSGFCSQSCFVCPAVTSSYHLLGRGLGPACGRHHECPTVAPGPGAQSGGPGEPRVRLCCVCRPPHDRADPE